MDKHIPAAVRSSKSVVHGVVPFPAARNDFFNEAVTGNYFLTAVINVFLKRHKHYPVDKRAILKGFERIINKRIPVDNGILFGGGCPHSFTPASRKNDSAVINHIIFLLTANWEPHSDPNPRNVPPDIHSTQPRRSLPHCQYKERATDDKILSRLLRTPPS